MARFSKARPPRWRLVFLCGVSAVLVTGVLAVFPPTLLGRLDNAAYDVLMQSARTRPPDGRIVIVDVDEKSLTTIGQWPWRRDRIGDLIARIRNMGAAVVALDMVFAEPDRYGDSSGAQDAGENAPAPSDQLRQTRISKKEARFSYGSSVMIAFQPSEG